MHTISQVCCSISSCVTRVMYATETLMHHSSHKHITLLLAVQVFMYLSSHERDDVFCVLRKSYVHHVACLLSRGSATPSLGTNHVCFCYRPFLSTCVRRQPWPNSGCPQGCLYANGPVSTSQLLQTMKMAVSKLHAC